MRELENIIERAVALCDGGEIAERDLPSDLRELSMSHLQPQNLPTLEAVERKHIREVLIKTGHKKQLAADILDIPRTTLWRKMKRYGLD